MQVCQKFFLDTVGIAERVVRSAMTKKRNHNGAISSDCRGKTKKPSVVKALRTQSVIDHIKKFPTVESHYCRKDCKARFLPENLNRRKMWTMYRIEMETQAHSGYPFASLKQYREIFRQHFNIKFLRPKKDQCPRCLAWKKKTPQERTEDAFALHPKHLMDKQLGQDMK